MGKLTFYYGAMNSGKTIELIKTAYNYNENGFDVIVMKPSIDTKAGDCIETRIGLTRKVDYKLKPEDSIIDILKGKLRGIKCIFVDEAQFLTKGQVEELGDIATAIDDLIIICYGLKLDFKGNGFEGSTRLLELADELKTIEPLCSCGKYASRNARMVNGAFVNEGESIVIDGSAVEVVYVPLCKSCYMEKVEGKSGEKIKRMLLRCDNGRRESNN